MKVTVHNEVTYDQTIEEYTDFKEVQDKYKNNAVGYEFPTGEQALTEIINGANGVRAIRLNWRTYTEVEKITKRITYRGVKLGGS